MRKRIVIYVVAIVVTLLLPFLLVPLIFSYSPALYVINPEYLSAAKDAFNDQAIKTSLGIRQLQRLEIEGHRDHLLFVHRGDIIRLVLLQPQANLAPALEKSDRDAIEMKLKKDIHVSGKESFSAGRESYRISRFSDGSVSYTQGMGNALLQVITANTKTAKSYFIDAGFVTSNTELSGRQRWFADHRLSILFASILVYALFWLMVIFKGGTWVAVVHPRHGASPAPARELKDRLLEINQLDVPFNIVEKGPDRLTAEWRLDKKWQGIFAKENIQWVVAIDMKLGNRSVSVIERKRKLTKEQGVWGWKAQFELFRGITFKSYESGATYGLSFSDNQFKVTGYQYRFNIQELKNPLIEVVTNSGWKWEPHIFFL